MNRTPIDAPRRLDAEAAIAHLAGRDPRLGAPIAKVGPLALVTQDALWRAVDLARKAASK